MYNCDDTYHEAVTNHVERIIEIHEVAMKKNWEYQQKMKEQFEHKVVRTLGQKYDVKELVWVDVHRQSCVSKKEIVK